MQSPFPGMDPFLEDSARWSSVHARLIVALSNQLADKVAPGFFVEIEQRVYIVAPDDLERRQQNRYIEIRDTANQEVVTTIELLSPFNKAANGPGYEPFRQKRRQVMASNVHWIEIDLLCAGERPPEMVNQSDYYALLKRGSTHGPYEVWFFNLRDRLPTIAVPLRPPFADVPLDLQAAFDEVYRRAHYADSLDYGRSAIPVICRDSTITGAV